MGNFSSSVLAQISHTLFRREYTFSFLILAEQRWTMTDTVGFSIRTDFDQSAQKNL